MQIGVENYQILCKNNAKNTTGKKEGGNDGHCGHQDAANQELYSALNTLLLFWPIIKAQSRRAMHLLIFGWFPIRFWDQDIQQIPFLKEHFYKLHFDYFSAPSLLCLITKNVNLQHLSDCQARPDTQYIKGNKLLHQTQSIVS